MFKKIMIATDLSAVSGILIDVAGFLKQAGAEEAVLAHSFTINRSEDFHSQHEKLVLEKLDQEMELLKNKGLQVLIRVPAGIPFIEIGKIASAEKPDLLIIGSHGSSMMTDIMLGSTAMEVIHRSRIPLLMPRIRIKNLKEAELQPFPDPSKLFDHILFPTDFSRVSAEAFELLTELTTKGIKRITFLYASDKENQTLKLDPTVLSEDEKETLNSQKERLLFVNPDCIIDTVVYSGSPIRAIGQEVKDKIISLIVMGSQGKGFIEEIFLGSLSYKTARYIPTSLLLVPAKR
jgi:nucleotide-binding universal stress UspA family protein